jgi:RNA polymerase sigma-70 factor (ECF subfamily)
LRIIPLHINEKQLIKKCIGGDRRAQKRLYETHCGKMLSVCRQYVAPIENAEDIMIKGFFKAFNKLDSFNHQGSFEGWLRRIMVRDCIDFLRKKDPFQYSEEVCEEKLGEVDEEIPTYGISLDTIQECIDELPTGYRSVFIMCCLDGYKHREIAEILGVSENTSKTQYRKARLILKEKLESFRQKQYEA